MNTVLYLSQQVALTNRFVPLCNPHNSANGPCRNYSDISQTSEERLGKVVKMTHTKSKILILGDNHARGFAERLRQHLGNSFNIIGYVKLNTDLGNITTTVKAESDNMTGKDVITLCGSTRLEK